MNIIGNGILAKILLIALVKKNQTLEYKIQQPLTWLKNTGAIHHRYLALSHQSIDLLKKLDLYPLISEYLQRIEAMNLYFSHNHQANKHQINAKNHNNYYIAAMINTKHLHQACDLLLKNIPEQIIKENFGDLNSGAILEKKLNILTDRSYIKQSPQLQPSTNFKKYGRAYGLILYTDNIYFINQAQQWFDNGEIIALLPIHFNHQTFNHIIDVMGEPKQQYAYQLVLSTHHFYTSENAIIERLKRLPDINQYLPMPIKIHHEIVANDIQLQHPSSVNLTGFCLNQVFNFENNCLYLGEAAHQLHPLAGQGLNLGLRDIAELLNISDDLLSNQNYVHQLKLYQAKRMQDYRVFWQLTNTIYQTSQRPFLLNIINSLFSTTGLLKSTYLQKFLMKMAK